MPSWYLACAGKNDSSVGGVKNVIVNISSSEFFLQLYLYHFQHHSGVIPASESLNCAIN